VEVQSPQAKPWLVRLEAFQIRVRPGPYRLTLHDEVVAVLPELVDERREFKLHDLVASLNPDNDLRRRWAVERTLTRLFHTGLPDGSIIVRTGWGRYRVQTGVRQTQSPT
jgi:hypothetical protein